jgi:Transcriptional regulator containing an amidase domain and an AraC-type DNA-binding HTH domain
LRCPILCRQYCISIFLQANSRRRAWAKDPIRPRVASLRFESSFQDPLVAEMAYAITSELQRETSVGSMLIEALASSLAARLVQNHVGTPARDASARAARAGLDRRRLTRVLDYIGANLEGDLTLARLASVACLSRFHFSRAFKAAVGQSPHHYVSAKRLELAKQLLGKGDQPLAHIALTLKFSCQANFTRAFREATGQTPARYRRSVGMIAAEPAAKMTTVEQPTRSRFGPWLSTRSDTPSTMRKSGHDTRAKSRRHHRSVARHRRATVESLSAHRLSSDRQFSFNAQERRSGDPGDRG